MRGLQNLLFALPLAFASTALVDVRDASACGGCLVPPSENTQVSGHRMILSISNDKTTRGIVGGPRRSRAIDGACDREAAAPLEP